MPSNPHPYTHTTSTPQTTPHQCMSIPPHPPPGTTNPNAPLPSVATLTDNTSPAHTAKDASLADAILPAEPVSPTDAPKLTTDLSFYLPINARFLYKTTDGVAKWKVDSHEGAEVSLGMKVMLKDLYVRKTTYAAIKGVMAMQKGWVLFQLSSDDNTQIVLIAPRSRARLGPITSLVYLLRYLWLDDTIPPPIRSTERSLQRSGNYHPHAHFHHTRESTTQTSMV